MKGSVAFRDPALLTSYCDLKMGIYWGRKAKNDHFFDGNEKNVVSLWANCRVFDTKPKKF